MSAEKIIQALQKKQYKSIYWLEGEEEYFIDKVIRYAEHHILTEAEASFNLTIFYGKDAEWTDIINTCRKYPMFSDKQVVILKEAQQMRDIMKLEPYIDQPLSSTLFFVAYKEKKVDGRSKLAKTLKEKGELLSTKKLYENQLPEWTSGMVQSKGFTITQKALYLLVEHIGNDLSRIENEIDKISVNLKDRREINDDDIEKYVGISKEYNPFELQNAVAYRDFARAMKIVQYFEANPKAAPIQLLLPAIYNLFSKTYMIFGQKNSDERAIATSIGVNPYFMKDYMACSRNYGYNGVEQALLLLHQYNLRSIGVGSQGIPDASLMKEMLAKMMETSFSKA